MVVARRLERDLASARQGLEQGDESLDLGLRIRDAQRTSPAARELQQHLVRELRNINRYPSGRRRGRRL
jgi:hypothetical protein